MTTPAKGPLAALLAIARLHRTRPALALQAVHQLRPALARIANAKKTRETDPTDEIVALKSDALAAAYSGAMIPFRQAILDSTSPEDAARRVAEVYRDWSPQRVVETVNEALQIAAASGAVKAIPHA